MCHRVTSISTQNNIHTVSGKEWNNTLENSKPCNFNPSAEGETDVICCQESAERHQFSPGWFKRLHSHTDERKAAVNVHKCTVVTLQVIFFFCKQSPLSLRNEIFITITFFKQQTSAVTILLVLEQFEISTWLPSVYNQAQA